MSTERKKLERLFVRLTKSSAVKFSETNRRNLHDYHGVYIILKGSRVLHVGRTIRNRNGLRGRLTSHLRNRSSFARSWVVPRRISIRSQCSVKYIEVKSDRQRALFEAYTTGMLCPEHIK